MLKGEDISGIIFYPFLTLMSTWGKRCLSPLSNHLANITN